MAQPREATMWNWVRTLYWRAKLRTCGARVGRKFRVRGPLEVVLRDGASWRNITIGDDVTFGGRTYIRLRKSGRIAIGNGVSTGSEVWFVGANDAELADRLGITTEELAGLYDSARAQHLVSLDSTEGEEVPSLLGSLAAPEQGGPEAQVERAELVEKLSEAITELDGKRKQIIVLYYQQHLTMKQIADVLNITESRISQLHASALFNFSDKLWDWKDGRQ